MVGSRAMSWATDDGDSSSRGDQRAGPGKVRFAGARACLAPIDASHSPCRRGAPGGRFDRPSEMPVASAAMISEATGFDAQFRIDHIAPYVR